MKKILLFSAILILAAILVSSCGTVGSYKEQTTDQLIFSAEKKIIVETKNGSISLEPWDGDKVKIETEKYVNGMGNLEEEIKKISINTSANGDTVRIEAKLPDSPGFILGGLSFGAHFTVFVPENSFSDFILKTSNGMVSCARVSGNVDISTSNGKIETELIKGKVFLSTSNGPIILRNLILTGNSNQASTSNGPIEFSGEIPGSGNLKLSSSNGPVTIKLSGNPNLEYDLRTSNGKISVTGFSKNVMREDKNSEKGRIGNGGFIIDAGTSNGSVSISK